MTIFQWVKSYGRQDFSVNPHVSRTIMARVPAGAEEFEKAAGAAHEGMRMPERIGCRLNLSPEQPAHLLPTARDAARFFQNYRGSQNRRASRGRSE